MRFDLEQNGEDQDRASSTSSIPGPLPKAQPPGWGNPCVPAALGALVGWCQTGVPLFTPLLGKGLPVPGEGDGARTWRERVDQSWRGRVVPMVWLRGRGHPCWHRGCRTALAGPWVPQLAGGQAAGSSWAFCSCPVSGEAVGSGVGWLQGAGFFGGTLRRRRRKTRLLHAGGQNETGQRGRDPRLLELRPWSQGSFLVVPGDPLRAAPCPLVPA